MSVLSEQEAWDFFKNLFGGNEFAAAGACANMMSESGFNSGVCEIRWQNKTGYSSSQATAHINSGDWNLNYFLYGPSGPSGNYRTTWWCNRYGWGYGLSQWTTTDRRTELWNRTRGRGLGIDDMSAQLQYIKDEFTGNASTKDWSGTRVELSKCTDYNTATSIYCSQYEGIPASSIRYTRAKYFYDTYSGSGGSGNPIRLHAQGNCAPYATLHLNDSQADQIFYAESGTDVFIHANVGAGDYFEMWTVDSGGVSIDFDTSENTFFTMHDSAVDITAHATGTTPDPPPYPPEPPEPIIYPRKERKHMPIWMYPYIRRF